MDHVCVMGFFFKFSSVVAITQITTELYLLYEIFPLNSKTEVTHSLIWLRDTYAA